MANWMRNAKSTISSISRAWLSNDSRMIFATSVFFRNSAAERRNFGGSAEQLLRTAGSWVEFYYGPGTLHFFFSLDSNLSDCNVCGFGNCVTLCSICLFPLRNSRPIRERRHLSNSCLQANGSIAVRGEEDKCNNTLATEDWEMGSVASNRSPATTNHKSKRRIKAGLDGPRPPNYSPQLSITREVFLVSTF